ncbi:MAG: glycosyltransferase [Thermoplasmatales archaeon]|nr:glycosyltransferase [Thermoplasmatales archaeon]
MIDVDKYLIGGHGLKEIKNLLFIQPSTLLGGSSNALIDILQELPRTRYTAVVVCPNEGPIVKEIEALGIKVYIIKYGAIHNNTFQEINFSLDTFRRLAKFFVLLPSSSYFIFKILISENIDLVYLNSLVAIGFSFLPRLLGIPLIVHLREFPVMNHFGVFQHYVLRKISTEVICASKAIRKQISRIVPDSKVVHDWVDTELFDTNKLKLGKRFNFFVQSNIVVGMAASLRREKGIFVFFEAAEIVLRQGYDYCFIFIGGVGGRKSKTDAKLLNKLIVLSEYSERFIITGWIDNMPAALDSIDILVAPNIVSEGFGKAIIEAGAMKKPVVCSDLRPVREIIIDNETGIIVQANDPHLLAETLMELGSSISKRKYLGEMARKKAIRCFSKQKNVGKLIDIIDQALK